MSDLLYFAYGSNLLLARIRQANRCPGAQPLGRARLTSHRLTFDKLSNVDGSGKATVVSSSDPDDTVWGLLLAVSATERSALDRVEGVGFGYEREQVEVATAEGSTSASQSVTAFTYRAPDIWRRDDLMPMSWYHALVVAGALESGLPQDWVGQLHQVHALEDLDRERDARERSALPLWY